MHISFNVLSSLFTNSASFFQNAPTQSLLSVINGILDESIERKNGEIPDVCKLVRAHFFCKILQTFSLYLTNF